MNVGILTGGGDCAGLNAVIRAAVKRAEEYGFKVTGIRYGWSGLMRPDTVPLTFKQVSNIHFLGGLYLRLHAQTLSSTQTGLSLCSRT
jgi:6-phosphofructokinase 1